eukprot:6212766-Pleurochrysis_carterae.AAC.2
MQLRWGPAGDVYVCQSEWDARARARAMSPDVGSLYVLISRNGRSRVCSMQAVPPPLAASLLPEAHMAPREIPRDAPVAEMLRDEPQQGEIQELNLQKYRTLIERYPQQ